MEQIYQLTEIPTKAPKVTVLMAVYNGQKYLRESIKSILSQSFKDFEFLIIDDASTDNTPQILEFYAQKDSRVRILRNEENMKLSASLNRGLKMARGGLIARMDADDISFKHRLRRQVQFMEENPDIDVCGTFLSTFKHPSNPRYQHTKVWEVPLDNAKIRATLLFESCMYHPTLMIRKHVFDNAAYVEHFALAQDYMLWARLAFEYNYKFANLPNILLMYRRTNVSPGYKAAQQTNADLVCQYILGALGIKPTEAEFELHRALAKAYAQTSTLPRASNLYRLALWIRRLLKQNKLAKLFDYGSLVQELQQRFLRVSEQNAANHPLIFIFFFLAPIPMGWQTRWRYTRALYGYYKNKHNPEACREK